METPPPASRSKREKPLVLVIDDVDVQIRLTQISLTRAGYDVISATDGLEGLMAVRSRLPDLIILDVDLPTLNGFQVLDHLRNDPATRSIPIVMMTAHAKDSPLFDEWANDNDLFMTKPFNPAELTGVIQRILSPEHGKAAG